MAFGNVRADLFNGRRLNAPGGPGDRFQRDTRWTLPESVLVLVALAIAASRIAAPRLRRPEGTERRQVGRSQQEHAEGC